MSVVDERDGRILELEEYEDRMLGMEVRKSSMVTLELIRGYWCRKKESEKSVENVV